MGSRPEPPPQIEMSPPYLRDTDITPEPPEVPEAPEKKKSPWKQVASKLNALGDALKPASRSASSASQDPPLGSDVEGFLRGAAPSKKSATWPTFASSDTTGPSSHNTTDDSSMLGPGPEIQNVPRSTAVPTEASWLYRPQGASGNLQNALSAKGRGQLMPPGLSNLAEEEQFEYMQMRDAYASALLLEHAIKGLNSVTVGEFRKPWHIEALHKARLAAEEVKEGVEESDHRDMMADVGCDPIAAAEHRFMMQTRE
ncbi:uncharacterized protein LTR77_003317 [Saxophila tyrrhenica]|uniref:Uncharacterized protein n=1 Tax=Saxophila tyrrhenica TaxID=1690608 RepID=A0AAV9PKM2_9PEZI|nr:hypothetical protein LTR77_003317 [Saxophila tyrrhenica]